MNEEKPAIQDIEITFRGVPGSRVFTDIEGYQLGSGFLGVMKKNGTMHIFPSDRIEEVVYNQQ